VRPPRSVLAFIWLIAALLIAGCCKKEPMSYAAQGTSDAKVSARLFLGERGKAAIVFVDTSTPVREIIQIEGDYTDECEWFRYRRVTFKVTQGDAGRAELVLAQNGKVGEALVCQECWEFKVGAKSIAAPIWDPVRE
jgi:hypothetical protein